MPIVNGQKMACLPCIRGHRSTKCNHGDERFLLQVRKPGRPLSSCPHPPGKACTCGSGVTTAALPKGRQCPCGSSTNKTNGAPTLVKAEPAENPPMSPTRNVSFRVQKSAPKPSRKQSIDASAVQRMNRDNLNLIGSNDYLQGPPKNAMGQVDFGPQPDWASYQIPPSNQYPTYHTSPGATAMGSLSMPSGNGMAMISPTPSSTNGISSNGAINNGMSGNGMSTNSGVSSGTLTPGTSNSSHHTPTSSNEDFPLQEPVAEGGGSCCSQRMQPQPQMATQPQMDFHMPPQTSQAPFSTIGYMPQIPMGNGSMMAPLPQQQTYGMNGFHQPELHMDPTSFGTHQQPLQQWQWQQFMASIPTFDTNHDCRCGPGCECLGCVSHPFNETTLQYIRDTMVMHNDYVSGKVDLSNGLMDPPLAGSKISPSPAQSPTDTDSPNGGETNLPDDRFLFVNYPDPCMCGDNCSCVNCMIHRDPRSETPN
ncbi:hypothetical protein F4821DRAFT_195042 [Hypoxylon rubiginosum]|uniref:Uncharacterized protein n=1 Tax=Hypoxylon rubiginosum TaxID=110542 RepID=A0ACC0CSI5_9PEZI|nr:hypothetical protein F4821DRAFT_195042 [Hypoxylon rubiginosum]